MEIIALATLVTMISTEKSKCRSFYMIVLYSVMLSRIFLLHSFHIGFESLCQMEGNRDEYDAAVIISILDGPDDCRSEVGASMTR